MNLADGLELVDARWLLVGAAAVGLAKTGRPLAKSAIKAYLAARECVQRTTAGTREGWRRLYEEAAAEHRGHAAPRIEADMATGGATGPRESGGVVLSSVGEAV